MKREPTVSKAIDYQVIVASVLEVAGRFLVVEEMVNGERKLNQPAGRLEPGETLIEGALRETIEETGVAYVPTALVGVYQWLDPARNTLYIRFAFTGDHIEQIHDRPPDPGILGAKWLTPELLESSRPTHRSPYVMACVNDYVAGRRYSLDMFHRFF